MIERSFQVFGSDRPGALLAIEQATDFARTVTAVRSEQETITKNLLAFPEPIRVRGIFFEGLSRIVAEARGPEAMKGLLAAAGMETKPTAFRSYPHRDFYRLYYLAARLLHPAASLADGIRRTARTFFPIFKNSLLGRTMGALMGDRPTTILPLLSRAYNLCVEGNQHDSELVGERSLVWRCQVEPVDWYAETFTGIIEGAVPAEFSTRIRVEDKALSGERMRYRFLVEW